MAIETKIRGVRVVYGANILEDPELVGHTVSEARRRYARPLNMPSSTLFARHGVTSLVNGVKVSEDYTLNGGDHLEFMKLAGRKG